MKLNLKSTNLINQVFVYSLDTSAFYSESEQEIHIKLLELYQRRSQIKKENPKESKKELAAIKKKSKAIKTDELFAEFAKHKGIRHLREDALTYVTVSGERKQRKKVVISLFESALTRTLGIQTNTLSEDIIIVEQFYADVLEDIVKNGFEYKGEKYRYFSSSAGQIRNKKCVFIKESVWNKHKNTLMCGLTLDKINEIGANVNKYLAYLSLQDSASALFEGFDIDRMIVVDDWEFPVKGEVDYIDNKTFEIERKTMEVTMNIVDGAGMCLPSVSRHSFQFRAPWMKGLISPFDFKSLAKENDCTTVKDIWGDTYDIVEDKIEIMITKSMFKMWQHYNNWQEYKDFFKMYNCQAGICQVEAKSFGNVRLGYQPLQSLNEMTDEELQSVANRTVEDIKRIGKDKDTMLRVLGATIENEDKNHYQHALMLYPEMLNDDYSRKIIKDAKKSRVKEAKAGRIEVSGKYLFVIPDWAAYLEWLLQGKKEPAGLIQNGEIYSQLFKDSEKVDIMRSPSLYREHGIRINKVDDEKKKWFVSNGVYVSYKDLLGKSLMMDFDGDQLFVVNEKSFVEVAERHMHDIVPLHYEMKKAPIGQITSDSIWEGLQAAFKANIGIISNQISIAWNREKPNLDVIKRLCLINNEVIDYAKTLYMSPIPKHIAKTISDSTKGQLPHFFRFAKDKKEENVQPVGNSTVDMLEKIIPNKRIHFTGVCGEFDYRLLMSNIEENIIVSPSVISAYQTRDLRKWRMDSSSQKSKDNLYVYAKIREEIVIMFPEYNTKQIVDMLIEYLYGQKESDFKVTLWSAFGDVILDNLKRNLGKYKHCEECGEEFEGKHHNAKLCEKCAEERQKVAKRLYKKREKIGDKVEKKLIV